MKSMKNTQSSINLISSKANKSSMINTMHSLPQSPSHRLNPNLRLPKLSQKQLAELKKYSNLHLIPKPQNKKEVPDDYVRKILFENQELTRNNQLLAEKNKFLEASNQQLRQRYNELRNTYTELLGQFQEIATQSLGNIDNKPCQLKSSEADVFSLFLKVLGNENQQRNSNRIKKQGGILGKDERKQKASKPIHLENIEITDNGFIVNEPLSKKVFEYKKSVSMSAETEEAETQTQGNAPSCSFDESLQNSLETKDAELIRKLLDYQEVIRGLEKANKEITARYDRIKTIITQPRTH